MPYSSREDLPDSVRSSLTDHQQDIFIAAFNQSYEEDKDEERAMKIAWGAVKNAKEYVIPVKTKHTQICETIMIPISPDRTGSIRVTLIQEGLSKNKNMWKKEVLQRAESLFEGALSFDSHSDASRKPSELYGKVVNVKMEEGNLRGDYIYTQKFENEILDLYARGFAASEIGLSIHADAKVKIEKRGKDVVTIPEEVIGGPDNGKPRVDVVVNPSAGGRLSESVNEIEEHKEVSPMDEKVLEVALDVQKSNKEITEQTRNILEELKKLQAENKAVKEELARVKAEGEKNEILEKAEIGEKSKAVLKAKINEFTVEELTKQIDLVKELEKEIITSKQTITKEAAAETPVVVENKIDKVVEEYLERLRG
jgi:cation transport regulator ChaB